MGKLAIEIVLEIEVNVEGGSTIKIQSGIGGVDETILHAQRIFYQVNGQSRTRQPTTDVFLQFKGRIAGKLEDVIPDVVPYSFGEINQGKATPKGEMTGVFHFGVKDLVLAPGGDLLRVIVPRLERRSLPRVERRK